MLGEGDADADLLGEGPDAGADDATAATLGGTDDCATGLRKADGDGPCCTDGVMPPDSPVRDAEAEDPEDAEGDEPEPAGACDVEAGSASASVPWP